MCGCRGSDGTWGIVLLTVAVGLVALASGRMTTPAGLSSWWASVFDIDVTPLRSVARLISTPADDSTEVPWKSTLAASLNER
jgi:hypothetical protein